MNSKKVKQNIDDSKAIGTDYSVPSLKTMEEFGSDHSDRSLEQFEQFAKVFAENPLMDELTRVRALRRMARVISAQIENLLREPEPAPWLYKNRPQDEKALSSIEFIRKHFSDSLGKTLCSTHIRKFDPHLYNLAIIERRQNGGEWPKNFNLPTKEQTVDVEIGLLTIEEVRRIERLAIDIRTRKKKGTLNKLIDSCLV